MAYQLDGIETTESSQYFNGLWRWHMRRIWQPMKPAGRRITYILLWITAAEIALIALGSAIYFIEYAKT